ncbi:hypothetical protein N7492_004326 [Penicillium capsulatum]|uniref:Aminoglycoside phosphotransferase domain-containing protein n=1 Tax=Penicillium capsulatum TaxID=69766 RepID=A0A9W9I9T0_9EURO|nr:hypothetical protein N7492_004326 [Penicillium capsulatum]
MSLLETVSPLLGKLSNWTGLCLLRKFLRKTWWQMIRILGRPKRLNPRGRTGPKLKIAEVLTSESEDTHDTCCCDLQDKVFDRVRETINLEAVQQYCTELRKSLQPSGDTDGFVVIDLATQMCGSFKISWKVVFRDDVSWLLKVPSAGVPDRFIEAHAEALRSEVYTMRLLRRETTIPIPEVFAFSDTCSNKLGVPFILMQFIEGKPLYEFWEDKRASEDFMTMRRTRCLNDIAAAMVQLDKFTFDKAGALKFDETGQPSGIGPMMAVDVDREYWKSHDDNMDDEWTWVIHEPFETERDYYMADINRLSKPVVYERPENDDWDNGWKGLYDLFFDSLEKIHPDQAKGFVLAHPDLSSANIIVSDEGVVRASIDRDKAHIVPRTFGNDRFPNWLGEDWTHCEFEKPRESAETLKYYRSIYVEAIEFHRMDQSKGSAKNRAQFGERDEFSKENTRTRKSLIYACLHRMGIETIFNIKHQILTKLIDEMITIIEEETGEKIRPLSEEEESKVPQQEQNKLFTPKNVLHALGTGQLRNDHRRYLSLGFEGLLRRCGES